MRLPQRRCRRRHTRRRCSELPFSSAQVQQYLDWKMIARCSTLFSSVMLAQLRWHGRFRRFLLLLVTSTLRHQRMLCAERVTPLARSPSRLPLPVHTTVLPSNVLLIFLRTLAPALPFLLFFSNSLADERRV